MEVRRLAWAGLEISAEGNKVVIDLVEDFSLLHGNETPPAEVPMPTIHVPSSEAADENITANGDEPAVSKKKTRRGSRGGRRRRKPTATASGGVSGTGGEPPAPEAGSDQA